MSRAATRSPRERSNPFSSSVLFDAENYRIKVEKKHEVFMQNDKENELKPKLWNKVLRNYT